MLIIILSVILIIISLLPFIQHAHWVFRVGEFIKIQLFPLQVLVFILAFAHTSAYPILWPIQLVQAGLIVYHIYILMRYIKFWRTPGVDKMPHGSVSVKIISCNIYQFNTEYDRFIFFGVHPPPPCPTEEETSKERDGDLLSVAKRLRDYQLPVVITGDFNNVSWAKSSIFFKKTSRLIAARIGRGILTTFHTKYWFFRAPLDLLFHSPSVFIEKLFIYPSVGSDHFPIGCTFYLDHHTDDQEDEIKHLEAGEMAEVNEWIQEGKEEESENR